jgi:hypothetical protein
MLEDHNSGANRSCLRVRQSELQVNPVGREVRTDKRTILLMTEPPNEGNACTNSSGSY